jgi:hypothetical protein
MDRADVAEAERVQVVGETLRGIRKGENGRAPSGFEQGSMRSLSFGPTAPQEGIDSLEAEDVPTPEWIDVERVVYRHRAA